MADENVHDLGQSTLGAETEVAEPVEVETVAEGVESAPEVVDEGQEAPAAVPEPVKAPETDGQSALQQELAELKAERARLLPLVEFAQRALQERQQTPTPPPPAPGSDAADSAFRLLWEGPAGTEEAEAERQAAFKSLPIEARREGARKFEETRQAELERIRDPEAFYTKRFQPLIQRAIREAVGPYMASTAIERFNAQNPDLANDEGYAAVTQLMQEGMPVQRAVEHVRLLKAHAQTRATEKSKSAAEADSRAVLEARRGRASAKPVQTGGSKPIKRSGFSWEDAVRDVNEATRGE